MLSQYPLLSQRLRNMYLSKQIHEDTLKGVCELEITDDISILILRIMVLSMLMNDKLCVHI